MSARVAGPGKTRYRLSHHTSRRRIAQTRAARETFGAYARPGALPAADLSFDQVAEKALPADDVCPLWVVKNCCTIQPMR